VAEQNLIKTPADEMVKLIYDRKRIPVTEIASILRLPISQIEEWAMALEKRHVILIEYTMKGMILITNSLTREQFLERVNKFILRKKGIEDKLGDIERFMATLGRHEGLMKKIKDLDRRTDQTVRNYRYFWKAITRRRNPKELIEAEERNYQIAFEIDKETDKLFGRMKKMEKDCNVLAKTLSKLKEVLALLDKQTQDVEKIDLKAFTMLLTDIEKQVHGLETKKNEYLKALEQIKTKISEMTKKLEK